MLARRQFQRIINIVCNCELGFETKWTSGRPESRGELTYINTLQMRSLHACNQTNLNLFKGHFTKGRTSLFIPPFMSKWFMSKCSANRPRANLYFNTYPRFWRALKFFASKCACNAPDHHKRLSKSQMAPHISIHCTLLSNGIQARLTKGSSYNAPLYCRSRMRRLVFLMIQCDIIGLFISFSHSLPFFASFYALESTRAPAGLLRSNKEEA